MILLLLFLLFCWGEPVKASSPEGLAFRAHRLIVDEQKQTVVAEGEVLIKYKNQYIKANRVTYFKDQNKVIAEGNVQFDESHGHTLFADRAEIDDQLKKGYIQQIKVLLSDYSKLSALDGLYEKEVAAQVSNVRYSPCRFCRKNKNSKPLWQVRARNAYWDFQKKDIEYKDAVLEFWGIPVFYMPVFSHPDPTVERRSGFLSPSIYGGGSGHMIETPYHFALDRHKDITVGPVIGTQNIFLKGQYRHRFRKGIFKLKGSTGYVKSTKKVNYDGGGLFHVDSQLKMDLTDHWRGEVVVKRTSNKSYLRRYKALENNSAAFLTTKFIGEGFYDQTYVHVQSYNFQGLLEQDRVRTTPLILPQVDINYRSKPLWLKSFWTVDGNILGLHRQEGEELTRGIIKTSWHLPAKTIWGDEYLFALSMRGDGYAYRPDRGKTTLNTTQDLRSRQLGRAVPTAAVYWRYPFINLRYKYPIIVEPSASLIAKPARKLNKNFPNEDSRIREIDDINHQLSDRFAGFDRIDEGSRLNYGVKTSLLGWGSKPSSLYIGQSYNLNSVKAADQPIGVHTRMSDYVIRLTTSPHAIFDLHYRGRYKNKGFTPQRHEWISSVGPKALNFTAMYSMSRPGESQTDERGGRQLGFALSTQYFRYWTLSVGGTREFGSGGRFLTRYVRFMYLDECFRAEFTISKHQYSSLSTERGITYMARINFLHLGDFNHPKTTSETDKI